jgi:hypothetical protein
VVWLEGGQLVALIRFAHRGVTRWEAGQGGSGLMDTGDGAAQLRSLADRYDERLAVTPA